MDLMLPFTSEMKAVLAALLEVPEDHIVEEASQGFDLALRAEGWLFAIECKTRGDDLATVKKAIHQLEMSAQMMPGAIPTLVVPFLGERGQTLCKDAGVNWFDLSGNARITTQNLKIRISGMPNRFVKRGRPSTPFAPKSARLARWLILHPHQYLTQRELARATDLDEGFTSKLISRLELDGYVQRYHDGTIRLQAPLQMLDAWREEAKLSKSAVIKGHVGGVSGPRLLQTLVKAAERYSVNYAVTGLAAAWEMTQFAAYRTVSLYLEDAPKEEWLQAIGFSREPRGANTWLILPNDEGVFEGVKPWHSINCVSPIQAYIDLKDHPERAQEASEVLFRDLISRELELTS